MKLRKETELVDSPPSKVVGAFGLQVCLNGD